MEKELVRNIVLQGTTIAHKTWTKINKQVLEALSSQSLEYAYAVSAMRVHAEVRHIQRVHALLQLPGANQQGIMLQIMRSQSIIHTEMTKQTAIFLRYVKTYPELARIDRTLRWAGRLSSVISLYNMRHELWDADLQWQNDIRLHTWTGGSSIFSSEIQMAIIEFLNLFPPIPVLAALQIELDPSIPLFEPNPLGWYDGWW
jgi:hypothetical protein